MGSSGSVMAMGACCFSFLGTAASSRWSAGSEAGAELTSSGSVGLISTTTDSGLPSALSSF